MRTTTENTPSEIEVYLQNGTCFKLSGDLVSKNKRNGRVLFVLTLSCESPSEKIVQELAKMLLETYPMGREKNLFGYPEVYPEMDVDGFISFVKISGIHWKPYNIDIVNHWLTDEIALRFEANLL